MSGALSIAAVAIGPMLVNLLFGPSYALTAMLLPWTLILIAPYFWINTLSNMIVAYGRYWMVMLNNALGASIFTLSFPFLVSEFDLSGVVIALALGLLGTVIGQIATLWRYHEVAFVSVIFRSFAAVALPGRSRRLGTARAYSLAGSPREDLHRVGYLPCPANRGSPHTRCSILLDASSRRRDTGVRECDERGSS